MKNSKRQSTIIKTTSDKLEALHLKKGALKFTDAPMLSPIPSVVEDNEANKEIIENKALIERNLPLDNVRS